jgi:hypothetical protein
MSEARTWRRRAHVRGAHMSEARTCCTPLVHLREGRTCRVQMAARSGCLRHPTVRVGSSAYLGQLPSTRALVVSGRARGGACALVAHGSGTWQRRRWSRRATVRAPPLVQRESTATVDQQATGDLRRGTGPPYARRRPAIRHMHCGAATMPWPADPTAFCSPTGRRGGRRGRQ